ncbi:hypothetical protein K461DRAFT_273246 [Myriangium duriaei CBS 260.36]|uniref:Uncharacterized protein n=1 Tax=Myriangium duriaei CBS 260.36 TaxID=1168546 RepID=A0A9P4JE04_9PEZI|nr:hypothetical protein K461DRAFT_273246 [Myriangium duriaei CBS 260.36]
MLPQFFLPLMLSTLAIASPLAKPVAVLPRQSGNSTTPTPTNPSTQQLINQINTVESNIASLNNTLNGFKPDSILDSPKALVIQFQTDALGNSLNKATQIVNAAQPFDTTDSGTIAQAVIGLEPKIASLLNNIVVHKPAFSSVLVCPYSYLCPTATNFTIDPFRPLANRRERFDYAKGRVQRVRHRLGWQAGWSLRHCRPNHQCSDPAVFHHCNCGLLCLHWCRMPASHQHLMYQDVHSVKV